MSKFNLKLQKLLLILILACTSMQAWSQVGINTQEPNRLSELDVQNIVSGIDTIPKGIMIPRMRTLQRDQIDVASDVNLGNGLMIYNIDEDCYNYYNKQEGEWKSLCGRIGKAVFTIDCSNVVVNGEYKNAVELTAANSLRVNVTVTKAGTYSISAVVTDPAKENGYFFTASGEFLSQGDYTIYVPGMGTPIDFSNPDKDNFTISLNGVAMNGDNPACTFDVEVKDSSVRPRYSMNCSLTNVVGEYYQDQPLNVNPSAPHYIEVTLNVLPTSFGATYEIHTNEVDGIKFSGTGVLSASPQVVRLYGEGVPFDTRDKKFYIQSNSESSTATCIAEVVLIIPPKKTLCIGYTGTRYGYNWAQVGGMSTDAAVGKITKVNWMLTDPMNFGPNKNSIVRYSGFVNKGTAEYANEVIPINNTDHFYLRRYGYYSGSTNDTRFRNDVLGSGVITGMDIVIIGWTDESAWIMTSNQAATLKEFCEKGGILLVFNESSTLNQTLLRTFFNKNDIIISYNTSTNPAGSIYKYVDNATDPILNGPFGNISGLYWGEDASYTRWASNLPYEDLILYSSNKNVKSNSSVHVDGAATAFRHRTLPFVWVGDGGFTSGSINAVDVTSPTICPFLIGTKTIGSSTYNNYPIPKDNYGALGTMPGGGAAATGGYKVYNSVFAANALAWCIQKAEELKKSAGN